MALPSRAQKKTSAKMRPALLALAGIIIAGGAYTAVTTDIAYGAKSLLAAVIGGVDTTPRVVITRGAYTPTSVLWPTDSQVIAWYDISTKNIASTTVYLNTLPVTVSIGNTTKAPVRMGRYELRYGYCSGTICKEIAVPTSIQRVNDTYTLTTETALPIMPNTGAQTPLAHLFVVGYASYPTVYNNANDPLAVVKTYIASATSTNFAYIKPTAGVLPTYYKVDTSLAYTPTRTIARGSGYAYGYWDLNNANGLTTADVTLLSKVAVGSMFCPYFKNCDVNGNGLITTTDASMLMKYAVGTLPPPGTSTTTPKASPSINFVSASTAATTGESSNDDTGTFKITYTIMAIGGDVYLPATPKLQTTTAGLQGKTSVRVERSGSLVTTGALLNMSAVTSTAAAPAVTPAGNYLIRAGDSVTYTVYATVQLPAAGTAGMYRALVSGIGWGTSDTSNLPNTIVTGLDSFKTNYISLN